MVQIAILGYGNIGSGVAEVILKNHDTIAKKVGDEVNVKYVLDLREFPGDPMEKQVVHDISAIINDTSVSIVVETMGGTKPAYEFVKSCLEAGKSVATSNKELVASHGAELLATAKAHDVDFFFEASVGGGIPIIRSLNQCVTSDVIDEITGILNGTTNFMLTRMSREGVDYDTILKKAQELGYAERHPEADVEGFDACRKIAILSSMVYGKQVNYEDIHTEGITNISALDMKYAEKMGASIKLFATAKMVNSTLFAMVSPVMVDESHPLYAVNDVMNGVLVRGEIIGDLMFYGAGAGKLPTASAVVADVIEAAQKANRSVCSWSEEKQTLGNIADNITSFFVRIQGKFDTYRESLDQMFSLDGAITLPGEDEFAVITPAMKESEFEEKIKNYPVLNRIRLAK